MARIKFFVHGGGTWREVNTNSGCVTGWGKIQFLYVRRGRLVVARRNSVLKGLRALISGKPTTVRDGPLLPQIRRRRQYIAKQENEQKQLYQYNHCCPCQHNQHNCNSHQQQSISEVLFNSSLKPTTSSTAIQCALNEHINLDKATQAIHNSDTDECTEVEQVKHIEHREQDNKKKEHQLEPKKELIIDEEDILLVRSYIENNEDNIFNVSLIDFDADDNCKRRMFYKINPLVEVSRSRDIAEMFRPQSQCSSVTLKDFITTLGLQRIEEVRKRGKYKMRARKTNVNDADKENILNIKSKKKKRNPVLISSMSKYNNNQSHSKRKKVTNKRTFNNNEANIERSEEKRSNSSDGESFKLSLYSDLISKRAHSKILNHEKNVTKDVSSLRNKNVLKDKSHKLCLINDYDGAGIKTKKVAEDKSYQNTTVTNKRENQISQEKRIEQSLNIRRNENNKTFNIRQVVKQLPDTKNHQSEVNRNKDNPKNISITKRNTSRPYSKAEDEAIVSWLRVDERANLVNGNRLWKELQPLHHKTTGHFRPWQSLRNRYLRYILPALADLAVPPSVAQKLRAAAAEGEIKLKTSPRSNSIFKDTRVRSAWALRPRSTLRSPAGPRLASVLPTPVVSLIPIPSPPITSSAGKSLRSGAATATVLSMNTAQPLAKTRRDSTSSSTSDSSGSNSAPPTRTLRSSLVQSPLLPTPSKRVTRISSPTYSELTRRFASRHRSTPQSDNSSPTRYKKRLRSAITQSDMSSDHHDREAKRQRGEQSSGGESSVEFVDRLRTKRLLCQTTERPRTRRLYNPRAL